VLVSFLQNHSMPTIHELSQGQPVKLSSIDLIDLSVIPPLSPPPEAEQVEVLQHYIRRHFHDMGNCLSAMDLQLVMLQRSLNAPMECLGIVRRQIGCMAEMQVRLGLRFRAASCISVSLSSIIELCRSRQRTSPTQNTIEWTLNGDEAWLQVDPQAVSVLILEIADHWFMSGCGTVHSSTSAGKISFQMRRMLDDPLADGLAADVSAELNATVTRYGGTLICGLLRSELIVTFPQAPITAHPV